MKKIFIISSILLLLAVVLWGIYFFAFREKTPENIAMQEDATIDDGSLPQALEHKVTNITSTPVRDVVFLDDGDTLRLWDKTDDKAYDLTVRGTNKNEVLDLNIPSITSAQWSQDGNGVILTTADGTVYTYFLDTKDLRRLKPEIDYAQWASIPGKILYKYFDARSRERSLNISVPNEKWTQLTTLPYRRVSFTQIPSSILVAWWPEANAFEQTVLSTVSALSPGTPEEIFRGLYGAAFLFSPDGQTILISSTLDRGGNRITLGAANAQGGEYRNFNIPTLVEKAVWSNDNKTIYYAQPNEIPTDGVMPNDYMRKKFTTRDTFWKLDTSTGKTERIIALEDLTEKIDATHLLLSPQEDALFFINRVDGLLYRLNL